MSKLTNQEHDFLLKEYDALREEVMEAKKSIHRLVTLGVTGILFLIAILRYFRDERGNLIIDLATVLSPTVPLVFSFLLLYEQSTAMRVGRFIRDKIEPQYANSTSHWESWLQEHQSIELNRFSETYLFWSTGIAFFGYYVVLCVLGVLAIGRLLSTRPEIWVTNFQILLISLYAAMFVFVVKSGRSLLKTITSNQIDALDQFEHSARRFWNFILGK